MADGSKLTARVDFAAVPRLPSVDYYLEQNCIPGGTHRNFDSYSERLTPITQLQKLLLCDPQTSGGLLVAVEPAAEAEFLAVAAELGLQLSAIGELVGRQRHAVEVF
jgi:selenide,water dikinase